MPYFSQRQLGIINRPTPKEHTEEKEENSKKVRFVKGSYVKQVLNELFDYDWQETIIKTDFFPTPLPCVVVHIRLTATTDEGKHVHKEQFGGAYVEKSLPYAYKAAATDGLKKCAAEIGLFADIYTEEKTTEPQAESPLHVIERLKQECIELEVAFTKTDIKLFERTVTKQDKGNYEKCIFKLNAYIAKTKKQ
jgi:Rad52/22 family double-strand break repair protein